ncbi:Peptidoglycan/xylan/chitin deacetylase, PgdA/CDA1 family [Actinoplanes philippinensis]|uniref:Peptidoglycan/xylan/chitin deacetylase, PgdA/CDA1 family n=1 Tax=Actinoplanes philippinensis TaxID=35752 RepID=A0A1I2MLN5_9ACTN|nr:polysaccharide deacetylase family protein [Actinoplanes philippinensis]SFF92445.1 Peptidoglycan/xylan/chitin deacetylase, PgdA/CDA1 family [Actinoplanes philippinensis]
MAVVMLAGCAEPAPRTGQPAVTRSPIVEATPSAAPAVIPGAAEAGKDPAVVQHGPRDVKRVALTFDADMTDAMAARLRRGEVKSYANLRLLGILEKRQIPATFFVTGQWAEEYPEVTRRIVKNPLFEVANHSYEHAAFTGDCYDLPRVAPAGMTEDVAKTFRVLEPFGGRQTRYFRFPGLCHDRAALRALAPLGVTVVDGDVVSGDPFARGPEPVVDAVLSQVKPGSIVIMHVTEANALYTDDALPAVLAGLRRRGLEPVTLSELLAG